MRQISSPGVNFFAINPQVELLPTTLPVELLEVVSLKCPDWTSPRFSQLFNAIT